MSAASRALKRAVKDRLQGHFGWDNSQCDTVPMPSGQPPPFSGELFVGICGAGLRNRNRDSRDDGYTIRVSLTRRLPHSPWDRAARQIIENAEDGLDELAAQIASLLHRDYVSMNVANQYLAQFISSQSVDFYGFVEPLFLDFIEEASPRSASWVHGDTEEECAIVSILNFGQCRRLQSVDLAT